MDWLDEVEPEALLEAQRILGSKRNKGYLAEEDQVACATSPVQTGVSGMKKTQPDDPSTTTTSTVANDAPAEGSFHERSVAIGNGYNAKGIQKARQGIWSDALSCWESALQVRQQVLGADHLDVANIHNNIGIALGKLNRFEAAIEHLDQALAIRTSRYGEMHAEVAATLHNTGNVYQQAGDLASALQCFCECKTIQEQIHKGLDHAEVARACIAIGHCYWEAESALDAREAYMDALAIFQRIGRPENDPEVQTTVDDIYDLDQRILREQAAANASASLQ
jgi:tetratricopeptide (TPR) repeat protein